MKLVIEIEDKIYNDIKHGKIYSSIYDVPMESVLAIANGTPLPKGHGNLVDYEELKNNAREYGSYAEATLSHIKPKTIIEADVEESEG